MRWDVELLELAEPIGPCPARPEGRQLTNGYWPGHRRWRCILCWVARSRAPIRCAMNSMPLAVCENLALPKRYKDFQDIAQRGTSSTGWFCGFKLHAINQP